MDLPKLLSLGGGLKLNARGAEGLELQKRGGAT